MQREREGEREGERSSCAHYGEEELADVHEYNEREWRERRERGDVYIIIQQF